MSDVDVMKKALEQSVNKYAPDPQPNRGVANPAKQGPNLRMSVPPHMADPALGGGYVTDNSAAVRAKHAEQDRNLHGEPPKPRKP